MIFIDFRWFSLNPVAFLDFSDFPTPLRSSLALRTFLENILPIALVGAAIFRARGAMGDPGKHEHHENELKPIKIDEINENIELLEELIFL